MERALDDPAAGDSGQPVTTLADRDHRNIGPDGPDARRERPQDDSAGPDGSDARRERPDGSAGPDHDPDAVRGGTPSDAAHDRGGRSGSRLHRGLVALRPLLFAAAVAVVVLAIQALGIAAGYSPFSGRVQYGMRAAPIVVAALAAAAVWWARRRGRSWDADLIPALFGGLGALTVLTGLHGTPFDLYALDGDQLFRTAAVTRFADSWWGGDYTYRDLPAYYAPTYFWLLGRVADLAGTAPWHMLKYGTVAVSFLTPIVSYLLWRRVVPPRVAALVSAVPLIVPGLAETYAWIVLVAFVPWWLQVGHDLTRPGLRRWSPLVLGAIGAVLFTVYYYFFFVIPIVLLLQIAWARRQGRVDWREIGRPLGILGISALGSSPYWAPLAWNFLTGPHFESLNNRWITLNSGKLALPMLEPSVLGALCLLGLVFLVLTAREALSRALLTLLVAVYAWHVLGFLFLVAGTPLMSFRMRELVPVVLLAGAALGLVRVARLAARRFSAEHVRRLAATVAVLLAVFAGDRFVNVVLAEIDNAHNRTLPNGQLPPFHSPDAKAWGSPPAELSAIIDARYRGEGRPVVLTGHSDLMALHPYYGFVQWNANYSHPTGQFRNRIEFLTELSRAATPAEFAGRLRDNPYDRIDVLVLHRDADRLVFKFRDDAFPFGTTRREISFPSRLVGPEHFEVSTVDDTLVAVLRR
ncbi:arabinofuranosyltransferase [Micromonospora sp. WMMD1102]|uniref:arabinofuranosyltransferase n=1 Tax=Micromonospora sp. WMMD1102 TaxID=3016105 RepID=UPI002414F45C|nr:arabinofuranosyltransferase [Micromonospora sp. WMMD1102]MDG4786790.1 arabinofuranosyltransferase [Micromonospora sp. WMMD1102]